MRGPITPALPTIGRIRLGTRERSRSGKIVPVRSEHLIFSSPSRGTLTVLAGRVGGTVSDWPDGPEPYRLVSTVSSLAVQVPPQMLMAPVYEQWSKGGLLRRCDGTTAEMPEETPDGPVLVTGPCTCTPDRPECKVTTRLKVVIAEAPGLGTWLCTTTSEIAGHEMLGQLKLLEMAGAEGLVRATIAIEMQRLRKRAPVPVLRVRYHEGLAALASGATDLPALESGK